MHTNTRRVSPCPWFYSIVVCAKGNRTRRKGEKKIFFPRFSSLVFYSFRIRSGFIFLKPLYFLYTCWILCKIIGKNSAGPIWIRRRVIILLYHPLSPRARTYTVFPSRAHTHAPIRTGLSVFSTRLYFCTPRPRARSVDVCSSAVVAAAATAAAVNCRVMFVACKDDK